MRLSRPLRVVALVIAIAALAPGAAALATSQTVVIQNFSFAPSLTTINVGESITWHNLDAFNHTATSDTGAFDTAIPAAGNKTIPFSVAGSYAYHCSIHPTMKGTVVVLGATATPTPAPPTPVPTPRPTAPPTAAPTVAPTAEPELGAKRLGEPEPSAIRHTVARADAGADTDRDPDERRRGEPAGRGGPQPGQWPRADPGRRSPGVGARARRVGALPVPAQMTIG